MVDEWWPTDEFGEYRDSEKMARSYLRFDLEVRTFTQTISLIYLTTLLLTTTCTKI